MRECGGCAGETDLLLNQTEALETESAKVIEMVKRSGTDKGPKCKLLPSVQLRCQLRWSWRRKG